MANPLSTPRYLELRHIQLPVGALASIAHRIAGALLFLSLPVAVWLLDLSLRGPAGYEQATAWLNTTWVRLASAVMVWSVAHHLFIGIRFLLIDAGIGVRLGSARISAWSGNVAALLVAFGYVVWIL
jgi:succinate dehydrogenase / fumarate reductase cytochrome b subunit